MPFQTTVPIQSGAGVPGDRYDDSPHRALPYTLDSEDAANNLIGTTFYTVSSQGIVQAGGTGPFAGLLVNSKLYALRGTPSGGVLAPTLQLPNQTEVAIASMGRYYVLLPDAADIGYNVIYDTTTGQIATLAQGDSLPSGFAFAFALVDIFTVDSAGLGVITLTPTLILPS